MERKRRRRWIWLLILVPLVVALFGFLFPQSRPDIKALRGHAILACGLSKGSFRGDVIEANEYFLYEWTGDFTQLERELQAKGYVHHPKNEKDIRVWSREADEFVLESNPSAVIYKRALDGGIVTQFRAWLFELRHPED